MVMQISFKLFKDVVNWSLTDGQDYAAELGYIPLPDNVVEKVQAKLDTIETTVADLKS